MNWADRGSQKQVVHGIDFAILKGNKKGQNIKRKLIRNIEQKKEIRESDDTSSYILVCIKTFY